MAMDLGDVPADITLYIPFATYGGTNGESITLTGLAVTDIEIYKNGSATQRASDAGYALLDTDGIDFDGITGIHGFSVDLSDNTDAGFYSVGGFYWVVVSAVTVDLQTVNFVAATFRIALAEVVTGVQPIDVQYVDGDAPAAANLNSACDNYSATRGLTGTAVPAVAADGVGGLPISDAGGLDLDTILGRITANVALASICTEARLVELAAANLPADVDTLLGRVTAAVATAAALATAQTDLDTITGADGVTLATAQALYAPSKAGDAMALTASERDSVAAALLDLAAAVETGITVRQLFRAAGAVLAGILSGAATASNVMKGLGQAAGGTTRVTSTVDADGNRSAVTLNL